MARVLLWKPDHFSHSYINNSMQAIMFRRESHGIGASLNHLTALMPFGEMTENKPAETVVQNISRKKRKCRCV